MLWTKGRGVGRDWRKKYHLFVSRYPSIVSDLKEKLSLLNASAILPGNLPWDKRGNPDYWDHTWTNFGDYLNVFANNVS